MHKRGVYDTDMNETDYTHIFSINFSEENAE